MNKIKAPFFGTFLWISTGPRKVTDVHQSEFIREHFKGIGRDSTMLNWLVRNGSHVAFSQNSVSSVRTTAELISKVYTILFYHTI